MGNSVTKANPVAVIGKGEATEIRLTLEHQRGKHVLDCRAFDRFTAAGLYTPTARGFAISVAQIADLADGFAQAALAARAPGLLGGGG
jgi:hypothetical protein